MNCCLWLVIAGTPSHGANSYDAGHNDYIQRREGGRGREEGREGGHAKDNIHRLTKLHRVCRYEGGLIIEYNIPIRDFPTA